MPLSSLNHKPDQNAIFFTHFQTLSRSLTIMGGARLYNGRVGVLGLFGLKTVCPFWCGSFQFQINKNEIEICEFEMHLENFLFPLYFGIDEIISA